MKRSLLEDIAEWNSFSRRSALPKNTPGAGVDLSSFFFSSRSADAHPRTGVLAIFTFATTLVVIAFAVTGADIMLGKNQAYLKLSQKNLMREVTLLAPRGLILDRYNNVLVSNKPSYSLELNISDCRVSEVQMRLCHEIIKRASEVVSIDSDFAYRLLEGSSNSIILSSNLSKDDIIELETLFGNYTQVVISEIPIRDYESAEAFSHVIGFVGLDDETITPKIVGKAGIEKEYDSYIQGVDGKFVTRVDSSGTDLSIFSQIEAVPGNNILTSLDRDMQVLAYSKLKETVEKKHATGGAVVVTDPRDGSVLTLVSYPGFDTNLMSNQISSQKYNELLNDPLKPFFNRAISASYAPGSTFKMVTASAALEEGVISQYTTINDRGYIQIGPYIYKNWDSSGQGEVDVIRAIQVSNDTFFYTVGGGHFGIKGLGINLLSKYAQLFGFGVISGIDIPGEVPGYFPDGTQRQWYLGDDFISAIGQGDILATPLQVNQMTSYFSNGGVIYRPSIVKSIDGTAGEFKPEVFARSLLSEETYEIVREGLRRAVLPGGTGYPLYDFTSKHPGIVLGGKTGTSEYINSKGEYSTHAWFTAFGPFEEASICVTVFVEGGGGGADDAAPIARSILDYHFR